MCWHLRSMQIFDIQTRQLRQSFRSVLCNRSNLKPRAAQSVERKAQTAVPCEFSNTHAVACGHPPKPAADGLHGKWSGSDWPSLS